MTACAVDAPDELAEIDDPAADEAVVDATAPAEAEAAAALPEPVAFPVRTSAATARWHLADPGFISVSACSSCHANLTSGSPAPTR